MKKYILLTSPDKVQLESTVNYHIDQGYQPCGGAWEGRNGFSQAMILTGYEAAKRAVEKLAKGPDTSLRYEIQDVPF